MGYLWLAETLWLRAEPVAVFPVDFSLDGRVSCLVQAVGYRGGTRPSRPIHIQNITSNENELRHDDETLHWIRRA